MKYLPRQSIITGKETILATFWQRALAFIIDIIAIGVLMGIIVAICSLFGAQLSNVDMKGFREVKVIGHGWTKAFALIPTLYFALLTYFTNGKTLGKWIMRIRVISIFHHRIFFWHCIERALGYAASAFEVGVGFLQIFWNPNRMCLHDRIAETIVIIEKRGKRR
jgi:uncharacterized RDD family membrane protein YckC